MNILFMSELFYPYGGGAELATYLYAKLLSDAGFNITVLTNKFATDSEVSKSKNQIVHRLNLFKTTRSLKYSTLQRLDILLSSSVRKMMKWADLVYVPRFWYSAIPLAKTYRKPVLVHFHDYISICPTAILYNFSDGLECSPSNRSCSPKCIYMHERNQNKRRSEILASTLMNSVVGRNLIKLIRLSDSFICVSRAQESIIEEKLKFLRGKIHVVHNPLPTLPQTEIRGDDFGYIGGPDRLKGFHVLCRAFDCLTDKAIRLRASGFHDSLTRSLESRSRQMVFYERLKGKEFEEFWKQIRALVVPSICCEPLPYAVSEAMLRGRVLIASNVGGIPEQTIGCKGAFLVKPEDHRQLADAIDFVSKLDKEKLMELSFQNREAFLKRFDNESIVKRFASICENLA